MSERVVNIDIINQRVTQCLPTIVTMAENWRRELLGWVPLTVLNPQQFEYSEMSLCECLEDEPLKSLFNDFGYTLTYAQVQADGTKKSHRYFMNANHVICLFPGQFVRYGQIPLYKGEKLDFLLQKAPKLITRFNQGITLLHGTQFDIKKSLGFDYQPAEEPTIVFTRGDHGKIIKQ